MVCGDWMALLHCGTTLATCGGKRHTPGPHTTGTLLAHEREPFFYERNEGTHTRHKIRSRPLGSLAHCAFLRPLTSRPSNMAAVHLCSADRPRAKRASWRKLCHKTPRKHARPSSPPCPSCCQHVHELKCLCAPSTTRLPSQPPPGGTCCPGAVPRTCLLCLIGLWTP